MDKWSVSTVAPRAALAAVVLRRDHREVIGGQRCEVRRVAAKAAPGPTVLTRRSMVTTVNVSIRDRGIADVRLIEIEPSD